MSAVEKKVINFGNLFGRTAGLAIMTRGQTTFDQPFSCMHGKILVISCMYSSSFLLLSYGNIQWSVHREVSCIDPHRNIVVMLGLHPCEGLRGYSASVISLSVFFRLTNF